MTDRSTSPLPVPEGAEEVVLFGGSFDPPHEGHVQLADAARRAVGDHAWLVPVPAARSPHKDDAPGAPGEHRARMLEIAFEGVPRVGVWDEELRRAESGASASYWIDTLRTARDSTPASTRLYFVIGADQLLVLPRWRRWQELLECADPLVLRRSAGEGSMSVDDLFDAAGATPAWAGAFERAYWEPRIVEAPLVDVSSTAIRAAFGRGDRPIEGLDPRVLEYIETHALYSVGRETGLT